MNSILDTLRSIFNAPVRFLNQPLVKESVKNIAGTATFVFGLMEIHDVYEILCGREIVSESYPEQPKWVQASYKVIVICAKISLILSAGVSRPGMFIISSLMGCAFSTSQLDQTFGPNTVFSVNPWHPRHVISIVAVILALPALAHSIYNGINWACRKIQQLHVAHIQGQDIQVWLTDSKIRLMNVFNTITSRPALHLGNQLSRFILRPI